MTQYSYRVPYDRLHSTSSNSGGVDKYIHKGEITK